ncbi:unnamed protein product [Urochloa humidicola]
MEQASTAMPTTQIPCRSSQIREQKVVTRFFSFMQSWNARETRQVGGSASVLLRAYLYSLHHAHGPLIHIKTTEKNVLGGPSIAF